MEYDLINFFLIVANHSLPDNIEKYIEAMVKIPVKVEHDDYVTWLRYGIERRLGRDKIKGFIYPMAESKNYTSFTNEDYMSFERNRETLINGLNEIVGGKNFFRMKYLPKIIGFANSLQSREVFRVFTESEEYVIEKYTYPPKLTDDTPELEGIFALACYGLASFLADIKKGGRDRIKICAHCNHFFLWKRRDERNRFCSDECRHLHNSVQRKSNDGKAKRAEYMVGYRKVLKEKRQKMKRKEKLKRLMDGGHAREEAEKILNDPDT